MNQRATPPSSSPDLCAQQSIPLYSEPQKSESHTIFPAGLRDDIDALIDSGGLSEPLRAVETCGLQLQATRGDEEEFKSSYTLYTLADDGQMELCDDAGPVRLQLHGTKQDGFGDGSTSELKVNEPDPCYYANDTTSGSNFVTTTSPIQSSVSMVSIDIRDSIPSADGNNQVLTQSQELHRYREALLVTRNAHGTTERVKRETATVAEVESAVGKHLKAQQERLAEEKGSLQAALTQTRAVTQFGTTDVLAQNQMGACDQLFGLNDSIRLGVRRKFSYFAFLVIQFHFWYGMQAHYSNNVASQGTMSQGIPELWLGNGTQNSKVVYQASTDLSYPLKLEFLPDDLSCYRQQAVAFKIFLCCVCLFASAYVKRIDCYFPQICSASDGEYLQPTQSQRSVSEAQRLKQLQKMSVLVLRTLAWALVLFESAVQMVKFDQEGVAFGADSLNCVRAAAFAIYLTVFSPSTIYWMYDTFRWVIIWTIFPAQIFLYLTFGGQYVTLCCTLNLAAQACTLNIARIHIIGILHEWSAAKQTQELTWVLAWYILASELELAPYLIAITAASSAVVCVKVWIARLYCDAAIGTGDS